MIYQTLTYGQLPSADDFHAAYEREIGNAKYRITLSQAMLRPVTDAPLGLANGQSISYGVPSARSPPIP